MQFKIEKKLKVVNIYIVRHFRLGNSEKFENIEEQSKKSKKTKNQKKQKL